MGLDISSHVRVGLQHQAGNWADLKSIRETLSILSRVRTVLEVCYLYLRKRKSRTMLSGTSPTGHINR